MTARDYYNSIRADRTAWKESRPQKCMHCRRPFGWDRYSDAYLWPEIHEILSRAQAPNAWWWRGNGLLLCQRCHPKVAALSHAEQLAIKLRADPEFYDLQEWLRRRNPHAMGYVTEDDVRRAS